MTEGIALVTIDRQDPAVERASRPCRYEVPLEEKTTVLHLLGLIFERYDPELAYRRCNCYRGVCGACLVNVNGRNLRACSVIVKPGDSIRLGPARGYRLVRDLVVDSGTRPGDEAEADEAGPPTPEG